jgi:uncharacterized metal-binding protein
MNIRPKDGCGCGGSDAVVLACSGASDVGYMHLRLADMGTEKGKTPAAQSRIEEVVNKASQLLA